MKILSLAKKILNHDKIIFALLITVFCAFYTNSVGQDSNFDLLNYHFFTGYSYLNDRTGDIAPANIQSFTHSAMNVLAFIAFDKFMFPYSTWLILLFQLLSIPALLLIAEEINIGITGKKNSLEKNLALILCVIAPLWLSELGTSFFSSTTAPLVLWSLYFILKNNKSSNYEGILAGILMGVALGLKLTNAPYVLGAVVAILVKIAIKHNNAFKFFIMYAIGGVIGVGITSHWYWELWETWRSPLFPFYNKLFKSPYFDLINWRDNRWVFKDFNQYVKFTIDSIVETNKTSEFSFKDARIIIISILPIIFLIKIKNTFKNNSIIFISFFYVSYIIWATLFAYQRYAIPLEIMYGLIIWLGIINFTKNTLIKSLTLIIIILGCLYKFSIPNWGHVAPSKMHSNPFQISFSKHFENIPARYIVDGVTISYVLKYLHPQSQFYGVGFSAQVNTLIKNIVSKSSDMPLRIITNTHNINKLPNTLRKLGLSERMLICSPIKAIVGNYLVCTITEENIQLNTAGINIQYNGIVSSNISDPESNTQFIYVEGLSHYEENGRWSEGKVVTWTLPNCLKNKKLLFSLTGLAYGPNVGKLFTLHVAQKTYYFSLKDISNSVQINIMNDDNICINSFRLDIPQPVSPNQLGESQDTRNLGILIQNISLKQQ